MKTARVVTLALLCVVSDRANAMAIEPELPLPDSDQPPKSAFIFPGNFQFLYISPPDRRFHGHDAFAIELPKASEPDFAKTFLAAKSGKLPAAKAKTPFLLMVGLPGGRHPSKFSYRLVEASINEHKINCELQFTYHINPNAGPGIGRTVYFVAKMPALPAGDYIIRFQVVKSYFDRGDGLMRLDPKRDGLEDTPYEAKFSINE